MIFSPHRTTSLVITLIIMSTIISYAESQGEFGYWACVLYCPRSSLRFTSPYGGPCRIDTNCALAFAGAIDQFLTPCKATSYQDFASTAQFLAVPFGDFDSCNNYGSVVSDIQNQMQSAPTTSVNQVDSSDGSCSCNTIVTDILNTMLENVIPQTPTATGICTFLVDKVVTKMVDSALKICNLAIGSNKIAAKICKLIMNVVNAVFSPVKDLVVGICATILQTVLDVLHLSSTLSGIMSSIKTQGSKYITSVANGFCGVTICTGPTQTACVKQNSQLGAVIDSSIGTLCKAFGAGHSCFPGQSNILLCNGESKQLQLLQTGDNVRTTDGLCSNVFFFSSKLLDVWGNYVQLKLRHTIIPTTGNEVFYTSLNGSIQTAYFTDISNHDLTLNVHHKNYLPTADGRLISAHAISIGEILLSATGNRVMVVKKEDVYLSGFLHPHTLSLKDYIIDGIQVSQFTKKIHPAYALPGLHFVRAIGYMGFPVDNNIIRNVIYSLFTDNWQIITRVMVTLACIRNMLFIANNNNKNYETETYRSVS